MIPHYPELARMVPELRDSTIRERLIDRYGLIYQLEDSRVVIAAVIHARQDFPSQ